MWSALYLERLLEAAGERLARDRFERCVEALFRLTDEESRRDKVRDWLREEPEVLTAITDAPTEEADRVVRAVSRIGQERRTLGVLHGSAETWRVDLPEACSREAERAWFNQRGLTHRGRGALDAAEDAFERVASLSESGDLDRWQAAALTNLGLVAGTRGNLDAAKEYLQNSRVIRREEGDQHGQAQSLNNLGLVARKRGKLDAAEEYHQDSLAIEQEVGDQHGQATSLTSLGVVAWKRGNLDTAEEYWEKTLKISLDLEAISTAFTAIGNLIDLCEQRDRLDKAVDWCEQATSLAEQIGDDEALARFQNRREQLTG